MSDEKESDSLAYELYPILGQCPDEGTNDSERSPSCISCPVSDCPTRGLLSPERMKSIIDAEKSAPLTPVQMTFSSLAVFVLPLICALIGLGTLSTLLGQVPAALIGFVAGILIARVFYH